MIQTIVLSSAIVSRRCCGDALRLPASSSSGPSSHVPNLRCRTPSALPTPSHLTCPSVPSGSHELIPAPHQF
jgi:hypothetical protein